MDAERLRDLPASVSSCYQLASLDSRKSLKLSSTTDMGAKSEARNKYLLVVVERISKFLFAYPLPNKTAENVAKKLFELLLAFGIPPSLHSDPGTEFTADFVLHLYKWLNATIDYGPSDHPRAQGAVERLGRWIYETLMELCKT